MTDVRADDLDEGERLPWLEAVEEDETKQGPSMGKMIVALLIGLVAIGGIVGGFFWLGDRGGAPSAGPVETIAAPAGDYKTKPNAPGGMQVEGEGDTSYAASAGAEPKGNIDTSAVPEAPMTKPAAPQPATQPAAAKPDAAKPVQTAKVAPPPAKPQVATPTPAPAAGGGSTIQLGALSSGASAEGVWKTMSGRFKYLAPLNHSVVKAEVGGKTYYRLRANGPDAKGICARLRVAGENCVAID